MLQRSDTAATTGEVRIGKVVEVTVLRRSFVRTRTSTTPVWMGSVRIRSVCAPAVGYRRYYGGSTNRESG